MKTGLIHIYCGNGKGKTTAAVGLAVRAAGDNKKVLFVQFLKGRFSGELVSFEQLSNIEVMRAQELKKFTCDMTPEELEEVRSANEALVLDIKEKIATGAYDLLVLDEALGACESGVLAEELLLALANEKPQNVEVVFTGRIAPESLISKAHYVTSMEKIKHPYDEGISARKGIEY